MGMDYKPLYVFKISEDAAFLKLRLSSMVVQFRVLTLPDWY